LKKVRSAFTKRLPLFVFKYIQKNIAKTLKTA
jgi:hypothetical protein